VTDGGLLNNNLETPFKDDLKLLEDEPIKKKTFEIENTYVTRQNVLSNDKTDRVENQDSSLSNYVLDAAPPVKPKKVTYGIS